MIDETALKQEYIDHLTAQSMLSVTALQNHIKDNHPKKVDEQTGEFRNWSICENIGNLINCTCCVKRKIPKVNKNLGAGASVFLLSLKAYI